MPRAVVLLSGGMDSATLAYQMQARGYDVAALSIFYGQRHRKELEYAEALAHHLGADHTVVDLSSWGQFASSVLTQEGDDVPEGHYADDNMAQTVVPFRNPLFLSVAMSLAASTKAHVVAAAMHAGDHAVYPDCRPEFVRTFGDMSRLALGSGGTVILETPFINMSKADIVMRGDEIGVPWDMTWSCYKGGEIQCGRCGTCVERQESFALAGVLDPTVYDDPDYWKEAVGWNQTTTD